MSLEQQIGALVKASENLTGAVNGKIGEIDKEVDAATKKFDNYISIARRENSNIRISRNQTLFTLKSDDSAIDDANIITGRIPLFFSIYSSKGDQGTITHELIRVRNGTQNPDSALAAEFKLQVLGVQSDAFLDTDFYIWHLTWKNRTPYYGFQFQFSAGWARQPGFVLNSHAYVKLVSGSVTQGMCTGAIADNTWRLCGNNKVDWNVAMSGSEISSCYFDTRDGEMYIALPALVMGGMPDASWDYFPYVNTLPRSDLMSRLPAAAETIL
ncbi:hypothetical protein GLP14_12920 [Photobacterium carnosum]|uniref:hypothetical protein n=1 Tax=Photobacterium carnosum TaxID=2023717 RepID=UPI001E2C9F07|nr:hypothetical protein [Photobacterium carnosum]MCD9523718.1 hypothetical protein [Photobacterium carnosum]